jgi:hypothetical protein
MTLELNSSNHPYSCDRVLVSLNYCASADRLMGTKELRRLLIRPKDEKNSE